jgi:hypothetical protein
MTMSDVIEQLMDSNVLNEGCGVSQNGRELADGKRKRERERVGGKVWAGRPVYILF